MKSLREIVEKAVESALVEVYSQATLSLLRYFQHYEKNGYDIQDFLHFLTDFMEEEGIEVQDEELLDNDPAGYIDTYFQPANIKNFQRYVQRKAGKGDPNDPSYTFFSRSKLVPHGTWLVHFSDEAESIAQSGFIYGAQTDTLGLTTFRKDRKEQPGYNFGFVATDKDATMAAKTEKYGREAVLFQNAGVKTYHSGDEENQVIFYGPDVHSFVLLGRDEDDNWTVVENDERVYFAGDYPTVVNWVFRNIQQYARKIVRRV